MSDADDAGARLIIDLGAIKRNFRTIKDRIGAGVTAAAVKADAYGLGAAAVAPALAAAGCGDFFVATLAEGVALRRILPEARIYVLNGNLPGTEPALAAHSLVPVLNDLAGIVRWAAEARAAGARLPAAVQVDTGMCRLGLSAGEAATLAAEPERLERLAPVLLISHLACADEPAHPLNEAQRRAFDAWRRRLPPMPASLANSPGVFLGAAYHYDMVRPGASLYGVNPCPGAPNPMAEVARLQGKIIAVRDVDRDMTVGYGATHRVTRKGRVATVPIGYADGFVRALGNRASGALAEPGASEVSLPVVGRVSMDLITLDISDLPPEQAGPGAWIDLIGGRRPIDEVAAEAGTIGYELLTGLSRRIPRLYLGGDEAK